jgi:hypothetical protein
MMHWPACSGAQLQLVLRVFVLLLPLLQLPKLLLLLLQPVAGKGRGCGLLLPDRSQPLKVGQWPHVLAAAPTSQVRATLRHHGPQAQRAEEVPPLSKQTGGAGDSASEAAHWNRGYCFVLQGLPRSSGSKLPARQSTQGHSHRQRRMVVYQDEWNTAARLILAAACKKRHVLQALG